MTEFVVSGGNEMRRDDGWTSEMNDHMHTDDPAVAAVLAAAAAPAEGPVPGEAQALAVFRSVYQPQRGARMSRFSEKAKLIAAAVFGGVVVISGAATAATGSLPIVSHGHSHAHPTPAATHTSDGSDDDQGEDVDETTDTSTDVTSPTGPDENNGQGSAVSQFVQTLPKGHRGPAVCAMASDGKCKAGEHGQSTATTHGKAHQNTNSLSHRQNTSTVHGNAQLPHGKAELPHGNAQLPHGKAQLPHGKAHSGA
jgi:hypothetical protein